MTQRLFVRNKKLPLYVKLFSVLGICCGLIWAEKLAPVITARLSTQTFIDLGVRLYFKYLA